MWRVIFVSVINLISPLVAYSQGVVGSVCDIAKISIKLNDHVLEHYQKEYPNGYEHECDFEPEEDFQGIFGRRIRFESDSGDSYFRNVICQTHTFKRHEITCRNGKVVKLQIRWDGSKESFFPSISKKYGKATRIVAILRWVNDRGEFVDEIVADHKQKVGEALYYVRGSDIIKAYSFEGIVTEYLIVEYFEKGFFDEMKKIAIDSRTAERSSEKAKDSKAESLLLK